MSGFYGKEFFYKGGPSRHVVIMVIKSSELTDPSGPDFCVVARFVLLKRKGERTDGRHVWN